MLNAIGSSAFQSHASTGGSAAAGLLAQLDRYQKILSDCVNCDSAKTQAGKEAIRDISGKISEVKARIEQSASASSNSRPATLNANEPTDINRDKSKDAPGAQYSPAVATALPSGSATATVGSLLNVFA